MNLTSTFRQALALTLAVALSQTSCSVNRVKKIDTSKVAQPQTEHIVGVTTKSGGEIAFDPPGGLVSQTTIQANVHQKPYSIAIDDVQRLWLEHRGISAVRTIGLSVGIAAAALGTLVAIVAATKQSCPFVYSWDGTQYVFDAEPYGGAIARGLERDDYSELEHLRSQNGLYRLLLTNEVDETQFTNMMELWVVDHAPGSRIVSDENGRLAQVDHVQPLVAARDLAGGDLLPWLLATDRKIWEPEAVAAPDGSLRQEVILTFRKPAGTAQANLIANAATGLWGSYMVKRMVELRGRETAGWLSSLDRDPAAVQALHEWGASEGTYRLPIEVEEPSGWEVRGALPNGGPLLAEDRVIPLDVSRVRGDRLRIRLRPPVGFWAFNSFAIAYGSGRIPAVTRVAPLSAVTADGRDILPDLLADDDRYYAMPDNTDRAEIAFQAPPRRAGQDRTVLLHSRGWYQLHLRNDGAPDEPALTRLTSIPGAAAQFAVDRFAEWRQDAQR
jgi:hypothetical protein